MDMDAIPFLRFLLVFYATAAFIAAFFYLRYRRAGFLEYVLWGIVALVLPVLGPFLVIAARPGPRKRTRRLQPKNRVV